MCARKNKREVVFAKCRIGTAYGLVAVIAVLHFLQAALGFAKDWFANKSSRYFRAGFNRDTPDDKFTLRISLASQVKLNKALFMLD